MVLGSAACDAGTLVGKASIPLASTLPGAAIQITGNGVPQLAVGFAASGAGTVLGTGSGAPETVRICVPPGLAGSVVPVRIYLATMPCGTGESTYAVEDVRLVSDPSCP
jgi:hypothetical protein